VKCRRKNWPVLGSVFLCGVFYENSLVQEYSGIYDRDILECVPAICAFDVRLVR